MATAWWIFIGGGLGSLSRWCIGMWLAPHSQAFPWTTLTANALSSLLLGLVAGVLMALPDAEAQPWRMLVITGFCGGFSTYSSFTFDALQQLQQGQYLTAATYVVGTFVVCVAAMSVGLWLASRGAWPFGE